jgi:hypothetical protein
VPNPAALAGPMKLFNRQRIAFVFFPHYPEITRLDTMPFAAHIVARLVSSGWHVDVFLLTKPALSNEVFHVSEHLRYKYVRLFTKRAKINFLELTIFSARLTTYACVFSVGQIGSYVGGIISTASRCPYVSLNDEFPSCWRRSIWTPLERWGAGRANAIIVPSEDRQATAREELRLDSTKTFITIRNSPEVMLPLASMDWHKYMKIPYDKAIFLHAGSLGDWAQVPELLMSVHYWPVGAVLLLHSRSRGESAYYRQQLSHLDNCKRVFWSFEPLSEAMLHSLISYCSGSFGLYRNFGPNIELIGTSSGKIMRSIVCGTPVIASSFKSLDFVTKEGLGIQVSHPLEIPMAIENLMRSRESYRSRCLLFAASERTLRDAAWTNVVECVKNARNGVDLFSQTGRKKLHRASTVP